MIAFVSLTAPRLSATEMDVSVDTSSKGRVFEGIGMLSAGASSRLLIDYPEPQRSQILDFLFKPKFGASLHHLKVEIGGDVNSTDGSEPCHARTKEEMENPKKEYFLRGYENWLMVEAKKRDPKIFLDVLQWGAPAWVGGDDYVVADKSSLAKGFYTQRNADLIASYIKGNKKFFDLDINYCGVWNERWWNCEWIKLLRKTLDANGLKQVKIVAADKPHNWKIVEDSLKDKELFDAIEVFGVHYPHYQSTEEAVKTGKPLWNSEGGPWSGSWGGARGIAANINRCYIQGKMTKLIKWSLITSYYEYLRLSNSGMMMAKTPWSGHYEVQPQVWAVAHTTQFTEPGWIYVDSACKVFKDAGSSVALISPDGKELSIIVELKDAKEPVKLKINLPKEFASREFTGRVSSPTTKALFERLPKMTPKDGSITVELPKGAICSISTLTDHRKGEPATPIPEDSGFPLPYADNFDDSRIGSMPKYFSDQNGAFEIAERPDGKGKCVKQVVTREGIYWDKITWPLTYIGSKKMDAAYKASFDALVPEKGFIYVVGGVQTFFHPFHNCGPAFKLAADGSWEFTESVRDTTPSKGKKKKKKKKSYKINVLKTGKTTIPVAGKWINVALEIKDGAATAYVNGTKIDSVPTDAKNGAVGIACGYSETYFDNFKIEPVK